MSKINWQDESQQTHETGTPFWMGLSMVLIGGIIGFLIAKFTLINF